MSVRNRIEDAKVLWKAGRKDGAMIQILIAVAATARKRHPKPPKGEKPIPESHRPNPGNFASDSNSFRSFVLDEMDKITGGPKYEVAFPFNGRDKVPLETILYSEVRNYLVHEGKVPPTISFTEPIVKDGKSQSVLKLSNPLGLPEFWLWNLARVVAQAPENREYFGDYPSNN